MTRSKAKSDSLAPAKAPELLEEEGNSDLPLAVQDLRRHMRSSASAASNIESSLFDKSATAIPVAAIKTLLDVVQRSPANTMMGLQDDIQQATGDMMRYFPRICQPGRSHVPLESGCAMFMKYVTRTFLELPDFEQCRRAVLERGERLQHISLQARDRIASKAVDFVPQDGTILTHGYSRVVAAILQAAAASGKNFDLMVLEGRPDASGAKVANYYATECQIPNVRIVLDAAVASVMERFVDVVLVGAESVMENGGVLNKIGTLTLATCAASMDKPFYVAAESYKFARMYPLNQSDSCVQEHAEWPLDLVDTTIPSRISSKQGDEDDKDKIFRPIKLDPSIQVLNPPVDFTPAKFINLLFTDLGVLTTSAVSDELIKLYQ